MSGLYETGEYQAPRQGLILLQVLILGVFCLFSLRLWFLQIHRGEEYASKARENQLRREQVYAPRGLIRDVNGELVAVNEPAYALGLVREDVRDLDETLAAVSGFTGVPVDELREIYERDRRGVKPFEPMVLVGDLNFEQLAQVESNAMRWPGLEIVVRPRRHYLHGELLAHILGFVAEASEEEMAADDGLSLGDTVGKQGLERTMESHLRGGKGLRQFEVDVNGRRLEEAVLEQPVAGDDVTLSIDLGLQSLLATILEGREGSVVVMDADTGQLRALVSAPSFDSNAFSQGLSQAQWEALRDDPMHPLQNRAVQSVYPPGSVFKLVMAACGLSEGVIGPREVVGCPGYVKLGSHTFRCWRRAGHGSVNMLRALVESCDVYFYRLGMRLGVDRISAFANACGFGRLTGINLPHEKPGLIPTREWKLQRFGEPWQRGEDLNLAIGQGYTLVSPLQVACYISGLVNGGRLLQPLLVADEDPVVRSELPLSESQRDFVRHAMVETVESPHGTCRRILTPGVECGAKTGTAQVARLTDEILAMSDNEIPYPLRDHGWMAGFAHAGDKTYVIVAMVEHGLHGSSGAGPLVKAAIDYLFAEDAQARERAVNMHLERARAHLPTPAQRWYAAQAEREAAEAAASQAEGTEAEGGDR